MSLRHTATPPQEIRLDTDDVAYFHGELEHIRAQTYDVKRAELKIRKLLPVDYSVDAAAETITYEQWDHVGVAKLISSYADNLPRVDVKAKRFTANVYTAGDAYGYSVLEIMQARRTGKPIDARRARAAVRAWDELVDRIGTKGDAETGLLGLLNQPNASIYAVPNGAGGFATWVKKTPTEILADLNGMVNSVVSLTNDVEHPDTLLLPQDQYSYIASTPRSDNSDTTILAYFLRNNPYIRNVEPWVKLKGAGAGGTDRAVAYSRDPDHLQLVIPMELTPRPPQERGLEYVINNMARIAGVHVYFPLSICYADGI